MADEMLQAALAWAERGRRVFPVEVGWKRPLVKDFPATATTDPDTIRAWWSTWPEANIGVSTDGLVVIDVDVKHGRPGMASLMALDLPLDTLTVRTPTGGLHVYYSGPDVSLSVGALGPGLDVRGFHGYVLGPGSRFDPDHPKNVDRWEGRYDLSVDRPVCPSPPDLLARLDRPKPRVERHAFDLPRSPDTLERARRYLAEEAPLAVEGRGGDQTTYRVAAMLKDFGVERDDAVDLLSTAWNERCSPPWRLDDLRLKVENAYEYGTSPPGVAHPGVEFEGVDLPVLPAPPTVAVGRRWLDHGDPWERDAAWLYHQTLPATGTAILTAPTNAGKTFLVMALAKSLATGEPFFGIPPDALGGTIILTAEGSQSMGPRMEALGSDHRLPIAATSVSALAAKGALAELRADLKAKAAQMLAVHGVPVRLVVLDTLSASGLLVKEEDNAEAATAIKNLDMMSREMGALFMATHHPPKTGTGTRGASAIPNNSDYVLEIAREGKVAVRDLELTKARDAPQRMIGSFTLDVVSLGQDAKGREITSCVLSTGEAKARGRREPQHFQQFMTAVDMALNDIEHVEGDRVDLAVVEDYFRDSSGVVDRSNRRKAFAKCRSWAEDGGAIDVVIDGERKMVSKKGF